MEIKFITADETLPLRSLQLRDGWALERCRFESDLNEGALHLAVMGDQEPVCILSLHPQDHEKLAGTAYQLRGMATHPDVIGKGYGRQLVRFAIDLVKEKGADFIWCNARRNAYPFYEKQGFGYMSEEFEIPTAGPHREMYVALTN
jgi:GNAT superfamily N-acetyltransferase